MVGFFNSIFNLPQASIIDKKMPKLVLSKNFPLSASEKKLLTFIDAIRVIAILKPSNSNIIAVKTDAYDYPEIHLMSITLSGNVLREYADRCLSLVQKYLPLQIVLIVEDNHEFIINVCDKRINQVEKNKRTIEKSYTTSILSKLYKNEITTEFFKTISFEKLHKTDLQTTYNSYIQAFVNFKTANITGSYRVRTKTRTQEDMVLLAQIEEIEKEIISLKNKIKKEKQLNRKVALNIEIKQRKIKIEQIKAKL